MENKIMEVTAYRMFYDSIHDFKTTAMHVESEIKRLGIRSHSTDVVPDMKGRTHHDMWVSMKTVSHFNLGTALELMLKLLLFINDKRIPNTHFLTELHDAIPQKYQKQLESTYQSVPLLVPFALIAFINTGSPTTAPPPLPNRDTSSLRGFFEYFDEDVILWQMRYSWERAEGGYWRHYVTDISMFAELINRVMRDIKRH